MSHKIRVAINGFGRIGRPTFKIALEKEDLEVVAINDLTDLATSAHLLQFDSLYGEYQKKVEINESASELVIDGKGIKYLTQLDPTKLHWKDLGVDVVLECSGVFRKREDAQKHLEAGAKKVILSAPAKNDDIPTYLIGVNEKEYKSDADDIISNGSCTTNCLAPVAKVLNDNFGIERGFMTTTHAYTNDQRLHDLTHKDLRRARAAAQNIIPTTTGAATTVCKAIPELKGKLDGISLRVPTPVVSIVDFICTLKEEAAVEQINEKFKEAGAGELKGILLTDDRGLVSSDYKGNSASAIVDLPLTMANGNLAKVVAWYDNEWGYSYRLVEMAQLVGKSIN